MCRRDDAGAGQTSRSDRRNLYLVRTKTEGNEQKGTEDTERIRLSTWSHSTPSTEIAKTLQPWQPATSQSSFRSPAAPPIKFYFTANVNGPRVYIEVRPRSVSGASP